MERVGTLINKLKEQFEQQDGPNKLAVTAQLLLAELQKNQVSSAVRSKVSVVLPSGGGTFAVQAEHADKIPVAAEKNSVAGSNWLFETNPEIPTLAHQAEPAQNTAKTAIRSTEIFEFNKVLASDIGSLNDKLKEERVEVATALQEAPVRDLKKAIGVNDRYLFVNELFRGDENMYERSIKTINGFNIYPEAQYWIQRELKVKLSWPDNSDTVKIFDQLIKRRFS